MLHLNVINVEIIQTNSNALITSIDNTIQHI